MERLGQLPRVRQKASRFRQGVSVSSLESSRQCSGRSYHGRAQTCSLTQQNNGGALVHVSLLIRAQLGFAIKPQHRLC